METTRTASDHHAQLRALYRCLVDHEDRFHEFKQLLALYPPEPGGNEPLEAATVRTELNERIRAWVGDFDGLSAMQAVLWRSIVVEERFNVALAPWKEANGY